MARVWRASLRDCAAAAARTAKNTGGKDARQREIGGNNSVFTPTPAICKGLKTLFVAIACSCRDVEDQGSVKFL